MGKELGVKSRNLTIAAQSVGPAATTAHPVPARASFDPRPLQLSCNLRRRLSRPVPAASAALAPAHPQRHIPSPVSVPVPKLRPGLILHRLHGFDDLRLGRRGPQLPRTGLLASMGPKFGAQLRRKAFAAQNHSANQPLPTVLRSNLLAPRSTCRPATPHRGCPGLPKRSGRWTSRSRKCRRSPLSRKRKGRRFLPRAVSCGKENTTTGGVSIVKFRDVTPIPECFKARYALES